LPASEADPRRQSWRNLIIMLAALAAGMFAAPPIRESLGWPDEIMRTIAISLPITIIVHQALLRLFRPRR
jgi:hypothetical protein